MTNYTGIDYGRYISRIGNGSELLDASGQVKATLVRLPQNPGIRCHEWRLEWANGHSQLITDSPGGLTTFDRDYLAGMGEWDVIL